MLSALLLSVLLTLSEASVARQATRTALRPGSAAEVTSIYTSDVGMPRPLGLAWIGGERLLVAERAGDGSRLARVDVFGDGSGKVRFPGVSDPSTLAYDPTTRRLTAFDGSSLISVPVGDLTAPARRRDTGIRGARAVAYDPATGGAYVLHRDGLSRVSPAGRVRPVELGDLDPAAIAVRPSDGLLYVTDRTGAQLIGLDRDGTIRRSYTMRSVRLRDVRAMTFAPSADTTDDPDRFDLYVVDRGNAETLGRIAEVRLSEPDRVLAAATTQSATLVQTIQTSQWSPGSPDPSGIVYRPSADRFTVVDSEVDETTGAGYHNVNMWQITRAGVVTDTGTTYLPAPNFSKEPTGAGFIAATNTLLVSTDSGDEVYFDRPGADGRFGTADDVVTSIDTNDLGGFHLADTEDPEYDPITGHLFILDGVSTEVYDVNPVDGVFGNGNDIVTHFDVGQYGPTDVEGMSSDPSRNTLLIGERTPDERIFEVTKSGELVRTITTTGIAGLDNISGLALGPASNGSGQQNYWIVDRKVDNGSNASENDGLLFEIAAPPSGSPNTPPTLSTIGNKSVNEGSTLTFTATATDPGAPPQTLAYSLVGAPGGAAIGASTGVFSWTPTEAQGPSSPSFQVCVSDGSASDCESITVTVAEVNVAPVLGAIGNKAVNEGSLLSFTATSSDTDLPAQTRTYSLVGAPAGATIGATSGAFTWTPTEAQGPSAPSFQVCVSDGVVSTCESITVTVAEVNVAPVLGAIGNKSVNELATLSFTATSSDADVPAQTRTYSLAGNPTGSSIGATTGAFAWTPTEAQGLGTYPFQVCVSDGVTSTCETITVTVNEANVAPILNPIGNKAVNEGTLLTFTATSSDSDLPAQTRTYSLFGNPMGSSIEAPTGVFTWTPAESQGPGSPSFQVCVSDGLTSVCETITVTVGEVNTPPSLGTIGNKIVSAGAAMSFTAGATDADLPANTLTFSLSGEPAGAAIGAATGAFGWTPGAGQVGDHTFDVCVGDGTAQDCETITVTVTPPNIAPTLDPVGDRSVDELTELSFTATASDPQAPPQTLSFSLDGAPAGASIRAATGDFSWTPAESQGPGSPAFDVCVSDGAATVCETITVTVSEVNVAPALDPPDDATVNEGSELTFTATADDADEPANTLTFSLAGAPGAATIGPQTGVFSWTPQAADAGSHTLDVCVSDGSVSDCETMTITANALPTLDPIGPASVDELVELTFTATASDADVPAQPLTYSLSSAPSGAAIGASNGVFSWTPTEAQGPASPAFQVCVTDGLATDCETVTVTVAEVNVGPLLQPIGDRSVNEGSALTFTATATDADLPANALTYSLVGAPAGAAIGATSGAFSWTPTEAQGPADFTFDVCVSDAAVADCETITVTVLDPVIFADDFESGTLAAWASTRMVVQQQEVANGVWAARATSTGTATYAVATLPAPRSEIFYRTRVKVLSQSANLTYLVRLRSRSGTIGGVFRAADGRLGIRSNPASTRVISSTFVTTGVWHDLQVRLLVNGSNGSAEVWLDGVRIGDLAITANFGSKQIEKVVIGDDQGGRSYDFVFDDVVVDTGFIGP